LILFTSAAHALVEGFTPGASDYVFYTFAFCGVAFAILIILAYKEYRWLVYVLLSLLLIINAASMDGSLAYITNGSDFTVWVVPFLLTAATASYGYFVIALRIEPPHKLAKFKPAFYSLAVFSAVYAMSSFFWLKKLPLPTMWVPANLLFFGMIIGQVLPPLSWPSYGRWFGLFIRVFPVCAALYAVGGYWAHVQSADARQYDLNILYRGSLLLFSFFSLTIVIWQAFNSNRAKELAERKAIESARNEAQLQLALVQSDRAYNEALAVAARHRMQLSSVSHDLKQPITALRVAVDQFYRGQNSDVEKLDKAIDYIDGLCSAYIGQVEDISESDRPDPKEVVATTVFANALRQMFEQDALEKDIDIKFFAMNHHVVVAPLATMRIMTNLIANSLAHARASRILVGFRRSGNKIVFQVHDNGCGIAEELQEDLFSPGHKGDDSKGHGLGLSIVQELSRAQGMTFTLRSTVGSGTAAFVAMQRSEN